MTAPDPQPAIEEDDRAVGEGPSANHEGIEKVEKAKTLEAAKTAIKTLRYSAGSTGGGGGIYSRTFHSRTHQQSSTGGVTKAARAPFGGPQYGGGQGGYRGGGGGGGGSFYAQSHQYGSPPSTSAPIRRTPIFAVEEERVVAEAGVVVWIDGVAGEVLSPVTWANPRVHVFFDGRTVVEEGGELRAGGVKGARIKEGMEIDVHFTLPPGTLTRLAQDPTAHAFVHCTKVADAHESKRGSLRTSEQFVVMSRRASGTTFLLGATGERAVLHPAFLSLPPVVDAIHAAKTGIHRLKDEEMSAMDDLCKMGRTLAVRLAPAPAWVPSSRASTDRGIVRWIVTADTYGEEVAGRAVVYHKSTNSAVLVALDGGCPLAAEPRPLIYVPLIPLPDRSMRQRLTRGSIWRFAACRELPNRSYAWRAFLIEEPAADEAPVDEADLQAALAPRDLTQRDVAAIEAATTGRVAPPAHRPLVSIDDDNIDTEASPYSQSSAYSSSVLSDLSQIDFSSSRPGGLVDVRLDCDPELRHLLNMGDDGLPTSPIFESESNEVVRATELTDSDLADPGLVARLFEASIPPLLLGCSEAESEVPVGDGERASWPEAEPGRFRYDDTPPDMRVEDRKLRAARKAGLKRVAEYAERDRLRAEAGGDRPRGEQGLAKATPDAPFSIERIIEEEKRKNREKLEAKMALRPSFPALETMGGEESAFSAPAIETSLDTAFNDRARKKAEQKRSAKLEVLGIKHVSVADLDLFGDNAETEVDQDGESRDTTPSPTPATNPPPPTIEAAPREAPSSAFSTYTLSNLPASTIGYWANFSSPLRAPSWWKEGATASWFPRYAEDYPEQPVNAACGERPRVDAQPRGGTAAIEGGWWWRRGRAYASPRNDEGNNEEEPMREEEEEGTTATQLVDLLDTTENIPENENASPLISSPSWQSSLVNNDLLGLF